MDWLLIVCTLHKKILFIFLVLRTFKIDKMFGKRVILFICLHFASGSFSKFCFNTPSKTYYNYNKHMYVLVCLAFSNFRSVKDQMYADIIADYPCIARLNGTNRFGCSCKFFFKTYIIIFIFYLSILIFIHWILGPLRGLVEEGPA